MNLAPCPDCGNDCSLTATTCPRCGRNMKLGNLSGSNAVEVTDSQMPNIFSYIFAVFIGLIGSIAAGFTGTMLGIPMILSACITLFALGALFGFAWSKVGWKWGLWLVAVSNFIWFIGAVSIGKNSSFVLLPFFIEILPSLISSCIGAYLGAEFRRKQYKNDGVV